MRVQGTVLARNAVLNLVGHVIPLLIGVITIPITVQGLGIDRFGILALAWVILGQLHIFDVGIARATTKILSEIIGKNKYDEISAIVWTAVTVQMLLGIIGGFALFIFTPILVGGILSVPPELLSEGKTIFFMLSISVPIALISGSFRAVLEAAQRFDLVNSLKVPSSTASFLLPFVGVLLEWSLPVIVAFLVIFRGLILAIHYVLCIRLFPPLKSLPRFDCGILRRLLSYGGWVTVSSVVVPISLHIDRFMIGSLLTMSAVTYYSVPFDMVTRLWLVPTSLGVTLFPFFSWLSAHEQWTRIRNTVLRSLKYILILLGPITIVLIASAHRILKLWLGEEFSVSSVLPLQILTVGVLLNSMGYLLFSLIDATGRPDLTAKLRLIELPPRILLSWLLVSIGGVAGAALAWTIWLAGDAVLLFVIASRLLFIYPRSFLKSRILQTVVYVVVFAWVLGGITTLISSAWLGFLVTGFASLLTGAGLWRFFLDGYERTQIAGMLRLGGVK